MSPLIWRPIDRSPSMHAYSMMRSAATVVEKGIKAVIGAV